MCVEGLHGAAGGLKRMGHIGGREVATGQGCERALRTNAKWNATPLYGAAQRWTRGCSTGSGPGCRGARVNQARLTARSRRRWPWLPNNGHLASVRAASQPRGRHQPGRHTWYNDAVPGSQARPRGDRAPASRLRGHHGSMRPRRFNATDHAAAHQGHPRVVELLLRHGADVNQASNKGATPLAMAAQQWPHDGEC